MKRLLLAASLLAQSGRAPLPAPALAHPPAAATATSAVVLNGPTTTTTSVRPATICASVAAPAAPLVTHAVAAVGHSPSPRTNTTRAPAGGVAETTMP